MLKGDLVYIMGDPSRPILGKSSVIRGLISELEPIKHGTMAIVIEVDLGAGPFGHAQVLVQGKPLWVSIGFVKVSNEEG